VYLHPCLASQIASERRREMLADARRQRQARQLAALARATRQAERAERRMRRAAHRALGLRAELQQ
jgi:hypothetical protein